MTNQIRKHSAVRFFFSREALVLSRGRILTELSTFNTGHATRGFSSPENTNSQSPVHSSRDLSVGRPRDVTFPLSVISFWRIHNDGKEHVTSHDDFLWQIRK